MKKLIICANVSDWIPAYYIAPLIRNVDLTREQLLIYSQVPQKVNRVGVGLQYALYNATTHYSNFFRWDQFSGRIPYELSACGNKPFSISELTFTQISVLWKLHIQDQTLQFLRNNEIANSFPAIYCGLKGENPITGSITRMEIIRFMSYQNSGSPLFYRFQPFLGKILGFFILIFLYCIS